MTQPSEPHDGRRWAIGRFALGMAQMGAAGVSGVLLLLAGVTTWSLSAVVVTCVLTTVSVILFGSRREAPRDLRHSRSR
jgi:hypothetical protein